MEKLLEREKEDGKLLAKCVEELKKKGVEFDLLKEVDALRRAKSLRVEKKVLGWVMGFWDFEYDGKNSLLLQLAWVATDCAEYSVLLL
ncbi:hypothetical protein JCGZ_22627 [Jatropha curcas]|uniref:Uncharacterized protein n=1 Tax=Jatropha curcas TaxID=180498 RepID=A0A067JMG8_JATCU|nr:hypothetical protein JCGZ_22627 [Jatropha curcas]